MKEHFVDVLLGRMRDAFRTNLPAMSRELWSDTLAGCHDTDAAEAAVGALICECSVWPSVADFHQRYMPAAAGNAETEAVVVSPQDRLVPPTANEPYGARPRRFDNPLDMLDRTARAMTEDQARKAAADAMRDYRASVQAHLAEPTRRNLAALTHALGRSRALSELWGRKTDERAGRGRITDEDAHRRLAQLAVLMTRLHPYQPRADAPRDHVEHRGVAVQQGLMPSSWRPAWNRPAADIPQPEGTR